MAAKHHEITEQIIRAFYTVYNTLGYGFSEKVYHNAMVIELRHLGLAVVKEHPIFVHYRAERAGEFYADLVVNNLVIVELKAVKELLPKHEAQLLNYLKASPFEVGLLLNFGPEAQIQRKIYANVKKGKMSWVAPIKKQP